VIVEGTQKVRDGAVVTAIDRLVESEPPGDEVGHAASASPTSLRQ
jgi:hypothetical protein